MTEIPPALASQLKQPGLVVAILAKTRNAVGLGSIVVAEPSRAAPGVEGFAMRPVFDCTARVLPAFRPAPVFEF